MTPCIRSSLLGLLALGSLVLPACGPTPAKRAASPVTNSREVGALGARIDAIFAGATSKTPGCAVGVYRGGKTVFARGYGMADLEHGVPNAPDTAFDVASVAKQFTAAAISLLVRDGKISLDDGIRKYVPELPDYAAPITLRHLLQHTSGLRDYVDVMILEGFDPREAVTNDDDALWALTHQRALNFAPGMEHSYSNTGYFLASIVVQRVTGETLAKFATRRIFDPLGMSHTSFASDIAGVIPNRAVGYRRAQSDGASSFATTTWHFQQMGDGGLRTTIEDLAKWDANFFEPKVGGAHMLEALRKPTVLIGGRVVSYGFGLEFRTLQGRALEFHTGDSVGATAILGRVPEEHLSVAVLCNDESFDKRKSFYDVLAVVDPRLRESESSDALRMATSSPEVLALLQGDYIEPRTLKQRRVALHEGKLVFLPSKPTGSSIPLTATGERTFQVMTRGVRYEFDGAGTSRPTQVRRAYLDSESESFVRTTEPFTPPRGSALDAYVGRYTSSELRNDMVIVRDAEGLRRGTWGRSANERLEPVVRDGFRSDDLALFFERDRSGKVTALRLYDERVRNLVMMRMTR